MFKLENVRYKDILRIDNLTIKEDEVTCIFGKSGGGKTTLLKLLNHLYSYDSGSIKFRGEELSELNPLGLRREVVMLSQDPAIFPGTVRDNLLVGANFHNLDYDDQSLLAMLKNVQLDIGLETDASKLSGGEKQRLALATVLLIKPDIMLLDEPSSALDKDTEKFIIKMVVNYIKEKEGTLIMVTHSVDIAKDFADRIIRIDNGQIINNSLQGGRK